MCNHNFPFIFPLIRIRHFLGKRTQFSMIMSTFHVSFFLFVTNFRIECYMNCIDWAMIIKVVLCLSILKQKCFADRSPRQTSPIMANVLWSSLSIICSGYLYKAIASQIKKTLTKVNLNLLINRKTGKKFRCKNVRNSKSHPYCWAKLHEFDSCKRFN